MQAMAGLVLTAYVRNSRKFGVVKGAARQGSGRDGPMPSEAREQFDFFLSRRGSVADVAREVHDVLTDRGFAVFTQDYDIPLSTSFIEAMHEAIKASRDLVILLTRDYETSAYTRKEFTSFEAQRLQNRRSGALSFCAVRMFRSPGFSLTPSTRTWSVSPIPKSASAASLQRPKVTLSQSSRHLGPLLAYRRASPALPGAATPLIGSMPSSSKTSLRQ